MDKIIPKMSVVCSSPSAVKVRKRSPKHSHLRLRPINMLATSFLRQSWAVAGHVRPRAYCSAEVKVPIDLIKTLRTKTKAGISDCRNALAEAGLDMEKAEAILHKKAKGVAEKKSTRVAAEGLLAAVTDVSNRKVAVVEVRIYALNCLLWNSFCAFIRILAHLEAVWRRKEMVSNSYLR